MCYRMRSLNVIYIYIYGWVGDIPPNSDNTEASPFQGGLVASPLVVVIKKLDNKQLQQQQP